MNHCSFYLRYKDKTRHDFVYKEFKYIQRNRRSKSGMRYFVPTNYYISHITITVSMRFTLSALVESLKITNFGGGNLCVFM